MSSLFLRQNKSVEKIKYVIVYSLFKANIYWMSRGEDERNQCSCMQSVGAMWWTLCGCYVVGTLWVLCDGHSVGAVWWVLCGGHHVGAIWWAFCGCHVVGTRKVGDDS